MTAVALRNVTKVFPGGTVAVDDVSLDVAAGEFVALLGPSGCGKSTLLRIVAGLEDPSAGIVMLDGGPADGMLPWERGVAMVFQDYALYPHMNVADNISFPLRIACSTASPHAPGETAGGRVVALPVYRYGLKICSGSVSPADRASSSCP